MDSRTDIKKEIRLWGWAYLIVVSWYFINLAFGSFVTYYFFTPKIDELLHGLYLFIFYTGYIIAAWSLTHGLWKYPVGIQIGGQLLGMLLGFVMVSWVSFELSIYFANRTAETFGMYLIESHSGTKVSGKMDAFRIYNEYVALIFIAYAIRYSQRLKYREREKAQLEIENKDMELSLLKSQINPHFLFNTLNTISMLVGVSKDLARKTTSQLSDILRYALESGKFRTVSLASELDFIDKFLAIQLVRFDNNFEFRTKIAPQLHNISIPPMILQPLIENAVKYGVSQKEQGGIIQLTIELQKKKIYIEVADNGPGEPTNSIEKENSTGIGLDNTNKRLKNLYGENAQLHVKASPEGFKVGFYLPKEQMINN